MPKIPSPVLDQSKTPNAGPPPPEEATFSFKFWKQIDYFGLDKQDPNWFISVLNRLKDIAVLLLEAHNGENMRARIILHYHTVGWREVNAPIRRADINWVPPLIINNARDFPFFEFSISGAEGRIVGFWEETVFHIVLLDPLHNIYPTKSMDRKPIFCSERPDKYTHLLQSLKSFKEKMPCTAAQNCLGAELIAAADVQSNVKAIYLANDIFEEFAKHIQDKKIPCIESYFVEKVLGLPVPPSGPTA